MFIPCRCTRGHGPNSLCGTVDMTPYTDPAHSVCFKFSTMKNSVTNEYLHRVALPWKTMAPVQTLTVETRYLHILLLPMENMPNRLYRMLQMPHWPDHIWTGLYPILICSPWGICLPHTKMQFTAKWRACMEFLNAAWLLPQLLQYVQWYLCCVIENLMNSTHRLASHP